MMKDDLESGSFWLLIIRWHHFWTAPKKALESGLVENAFFNDIAQPFFTKLFLSTHFVPWAHITRQSEMAFVFLRDELMSPMHIFLMSNDTTLFRRCMNCIFCVLVWIGKIHSRKAMTRSRGLAPASRKQNTKPPEVRENCFDHEILPINTLVLFVCVNIRPHPSSYFSIPVLHHKRTKGAWNDQST